MENTKKMIGTITIFVILASLVALTACGNTGGGATSNEANKELENLYLEVLDEIWGFDEGLNPYDGIIAFDFTEINNLPDENKASLIERAGERFGASEAFAATYDELVEDGYIEDTDFLTVFEEGILITISTSGEKKDSFKFSALKWKSGLGADIYDSCTASKKGGIWTYELGGFAVA
ncbi:MAG: hypothetical protein LBK56_13730 [Gracilibacteraceae bacterium]|jgi:hypothetical protein|nr:hypothetical protein [Gracilibacteraceae bacterium]